MTYKNRNLYDLEEHMQMLLNEYYRSVNIMLNKIRGTIDHNEYKYMLERLTEVGINANDVYHVLMDIRERDAQN